MAWAGFGKSQIRYDMFDIERSAEEAKRLSKCERIYHRGQEISWDGKEILPMLVARHGGQIQISDPIKKGAVKRIFSIILWGELAAWKISAQLADVLVPLEAKMAATSQAHDEARHFYVMHDYLSQLGYDPERMDRAPQALLDLVLGTDNPVYKLLGMNLMIETLALTIFQTVRESRVEPVLTDLLTYYERDEARHVGLGMQYLPELMKGMSKRQIGAMVGFQCRLLFWALWENKVLEDDLGLLGIDARLVIERGRRKQLAAMNEAFQVLGAPMGNDENLAVRTLNGVVELLFPTDETKHRPRKMLEQAWRAFRHSKPPEVSISEFDEHSKHEIVTARGGVAKGETAQP